MSDRVFRTSELAKKADVNKETIRFYEKKGLLSDPNRTDGGYRQYSQEDLERLVFIKNAKELGFALSEIKELLEVADGEIYKCSDIRRIAEDKLEYIDNQLRHLKKLKTTLTGLVTECQQTKTIRNCPIIQSLSQGAK